MQSTIGNTYKDAKKLLDSGRYVLFTGTPCQIDGLLHYLNKEYDRLYTQDIICHGVPSPMVWQKYLEYQRSAFGEEIDRESPPAFRRKDKGWQRYSVALHFTGSATEYRQTLDKDLYMKAFLSNVCLRPSCYNCHSKTLNRTSDITLADFWGIDKIDCEMFDEKGTSLVLVNSEKGREIFEAVSCYMKIKEVDIHEAVKYNPSSKHSVGRPKARNKFIKVINERNFEKAVKKYTKQGLGIRFKRRIKKLMMPGCAK